jgi:hypothetical protein
MSVECVEHARSGVFGGAATALSYNRACAAAAPPVALRYIESQNQSPSPCYKRLLIDATWLKCKDYPMVRNIINRFRRLKYLATLNSNLTANSIAELIGFYLSNYLSMHHWSVSTFTYLTQYIYVYMCFCGQPVGIQEVQVRGHRTADPQHLQGTLFFFYKNTKKHNV